MKGVYAMLCDIFNPKCVKLNLESTTKSEVLEELIEIIAAGNNDFDRRELLEAVTQRENKMHTGIMPGVAIPHGYCKTVNGIIGALGFSRAGIEYDELDGNPVHLFFLLLMDESSREEHLHALSGLYELLNSEEFSEICARGKPQEVCGLLNQY